MNEIIANILGSLKYHEKCLHEQSKVSTLTVVALLFVGGYMKRTNKAIMEQNRRITVLEEKNKGMVETKGE